MKRTYVVMEARVGSRNVWVWGLVTKGPGFDEVYYTEADGFTPAEITEVPRTARHLFTVEV